MAEEIKQLIEKIQQEGIKVAEDKARQIEAEAKEQAGQIVQKAKDEAAKIIAQAQLRVNKMEESSKVLLSQAGRNLIISLRKEINALLNKIVVLSVRQALTHLELAKILHSLITDTTKQTKSNIIISLNKGDLQKLEQGFLAGLKEDIKKGVTLKASEDITGGFLISYDAGKSYFDFTDKALADYIGEYLKPELAKLLKEEPKNNA